MDRTNELVGRMLELERKLKAVNERLLQVEDDLEEEIRSELNDIRAAHMDLVDHVEDTRRRLPVEVG